MYQRQLGIKGIRISEVGLGCWQFGGDFGAMTKERAFSIMHAAVEAGITFFDTADVYGAGISEKYIGEFKAQHKEVTVATKYGRDGSIYPHNYRRENLRDAIHRTCERLQTDRIDLLQLHCIPHEVLQAGHIFDWLRECQADGIISAWGASVESIEEALTCLKQEGITSLQVIFNIFRQKLITELFPFTKAKGVGIIVRLPLASGLLSGKFTADTTFAKSDHRNYNADGQFFNVGETFAGIPFQKGVSLANELKPLLPGNATMAQNALRWILDHEAVTTVIPGASSSAQVQQNATASGLARINDDQHLALGKFYTEQVEKYIRGPY